MRELEAGEAGRQPVALIVGAGDALGGAIARRFAREGYVACVIRRSAEKLGPLVDAIAAEGGRAVAFGVDARKEDQVVAAITRIEREIGPIDVVVFNIGANVQFPITQTAAQKRSEEHTSELQSPDHLVCRLLLEKKKKN